MKGEEKSMSEKARESMNNMTIFEARALYAQCNYVAITGNGQLVALVPENEAEDAEKERYEHGF